MPDQFSEAAEKAYDEKADEIGIDEHGDELLVESDDPVIETEHEEGGAEVDELPVAEGEEVEPEPETTGPEVAETEPNPELFMAPVTWPKELKEKFSQVPVEGREILLSVHKDMVDGFGRKMADLNTTRRGLDAVKTSIEPHRERLQRAGIAPDVAIQRALAWDAHIQANPQQGILDYAKAMGVDLSNVAGPGEDVYMTPAERANAQRMDQYESQLAEQQRNWINWQNYQQQQEYAQRTQAADAMLDEFVNAKGPDGKPLHPFIEHVSGRMAQLIHANMAPDMESAYDMAVHMDPEIRAAREHARQAAGVRARNEEVAKVRKASNAGLKSKPSNKGGQAKTIEERLLENYDKAVNQ